jgi:hypothetical protein
MPDGTLSQEATALLTAALLDHPFLPVNEICGGRAGADSRRLAEPSQ